MKAVQQKPFSMAIFLMAIMVFSFVFRHWDDFKVGAQDFWIGATNPTARH